MDQAVSQPDEATVRPVFYRVPDTRRRHAWTDSLRKGLG